MKPKDALLERWEAILAQKGDAPAIFNTRGEVVRTFVQVEEHARRIEAKMPAIKPHNVSAIQIGNHQDWLSHFLACLRRRRVVLPIDESISKQQADAAVSTAAKSGITDWGDKPPTLFKLTSGTTSAPRMIRFRSEQILADCDQICETMGISDVDLNFGVIPISHSYGFSNLLTPLIARGVPMVLSRERMPRAVLMDLARTNTTVSPECPFSIRPSPKWRISLPCPNFGFAFQRVRRSHSPSDDSSKTNLTGRSTRFTARRNAAGFVTTEMPFLRSQGWSGNQ